MAEIEGNQIKRAVESMHRGPRVRRVRSRPRDIRRQTVWEGVVHMFDLAGHPTATRAYAWSSPIEGGTKLRFFAVLHQPPGDSRRAAVRAAIIAERRQDARSK